MEGEAKYRETLLNNSSSRTAPTGQGGAELWDGRAGQTRTLEGRIETGKGRLGKVGQGKGRQRWGGDGLIMLHSRVIGQREKASEWVKDEIKILVDYCRSRMRELEKE